MARYFVLAACAAQLAVVPALAGSFTYTPLYVPGSKYSTGASLTDQDVVVGGAFFGANPSQAWIWRKGSFTLVPGSPGFNGISSNNIAVGGSVSKDSYVTYSLASGKLTTYKLKTKPYFNIATSGINASGVVIAQGYAKNGPAGPYFTLQRKTATVLPNPTGCDITVLAGINDAGAIAGSCIISQNVWDAFIFQNGSSQLIAFPNAVLTEADAFAADGTVGGKIIDNANGVHGFTYNNGTFAKFDVPGAVWTWVGAIGPNGEIGGYYQPPGGNVPAAAFIEFGGTYYTLPSSIEKLASLEVISINAKGSLLISQPSYGVYFLAQCSKNQQPCTQ
jgi:hypothetical protein